MPRMICECPLSACVASVSFRFESSESGGLGWVPEVPLPFFAL